MATLIRVNLASVRISALIWAASSRVGATIRTRGPGLWSATQPLEDGQRKGCRLAGPGLGQAEHVAALEGRGDGLNLNRPRLDKAGRRDAAVQDGVEVELGEPGYGLVVLVVVSEHTCISLQRAGSSS